MTDIAMTEETGPELTIDELAAATAVPSRTIRFYQSKGALPRPRIRGRVAYYGPEHVERLKLIASLQDRGLRIKAIRELATQIDQGELALGEWLGLEGELSAAWTPDEPQVLTESQIHELAGERRAGTVAELIRAKLVKKQGESFVVESPGLLQVALKLRAAGISLETFVGAAAILDKHLGRAANDLGAYLLKHAGDGFGGIAAKEEDLGRAFQALRPLGLDAVRLVFGRHMQTVLREQVTSGRTARLPARRKR